MTEERRSATRAKAVCIAARVTRANDVGMFRVHNISDTGLMLSAHTELQASERIRISLLEGVPMDATIVWSDGIYRGVQFDTPIDSAAVLRALAEQRKAGRARALRLPLSRLATVYTEKGIRAARATDVSRTGIGLEHDGSLKTGMTVKLVLESGVECAGAVRWSKDGRAGIQLDEPLTSAELESAKAL